MLLPLKAPDWTDEVTDSNIGFMCGSPFVSSVYLIISWEGADYIELILNPNETIWSHEIEADYVIGRTYEVPGRTK